MKTEYCIFKKFNLFPSTKLISSLLITILLSACGGGSSDGSAGITASPANIAPVSVAGVGQAVDEETTVTLSGSASDVDGSIASYSWSETSGNGIDMASSTSAITTFVAPTTTTQLTLTFQLTVTDNDGATNYDTVDIVVNPVNSIPQSDAGADQTIVIDSIVILDGSQSTDPDGTAVSYNWSFVSTPPSTSVTLDDNTLELPSFTADSLGEYVLELIVNDGEADSASDSITVTVIEPNSVPVADAGVDQVVVLGNFVLLNGSGSSDTDNQALSYNWSFVSTPANSSSVIFDLSTESPSFDPDIPGDYIIALVVNDGEADSASDEITVTAGTGIGGIISVDTIWNTENSPYIITSNIQSAYAITLQVDAGVRIIGNDMDIEVFGSLNVNGSEDKKVALENVHIVPGSGPIDDWFDINIEHVIADGGSIYAPKGNGIYGSLSLSNSILLNLDYMYIWYPVEDSRIEKNIFINTGGISTGQSEDIKVYIRNNVFYQSTGDIGSVYAVRNWATYGTSETIVEFNTFLSVDRVAVEVITDGSMMAKNNYWNTLDTVIIESMINDVNDDLSLPSEISYDLFLTEPHVDTPDPTSYLPQ